MIKKGIVGPPPAELPVEAVHARRFEKARSAQAAAVLEDYVELIDDLLASGGEARPTDIAHRLGVTHATAIKTIARLKREGLATSKLYRGVFLTPEGHGLADRVRSRHRLVVDAVLHEVLVLEPQDPGAAGQDRQERVEGVDVGRDGDLDGRRRIGGVRRERGAGHRGSGQRDRGHREGGGAAHQGSA